MAQEGFKRKLAVIISKVTKSCSRPMHDPQEPMSHKLTPYSTSKTDIAQQYWR
jgi:hypothetical protein